MVEPDEAYQDKSNYRALARRLRSTSARVVVVLFSNRPWTSSHFLLPLDGVVISPFSIKTVWPPRSSQCRCLMMAVQRQNGTVVLTFSKRELTPLARVGRCK